MNKDVEKTKEAALAETENEEEQVVELIISSAACASSSGLQHWVAYLRQTTKTAKYAFYIVSLPPKTQPKTIKKKIVIERLMSGCRLHEAPHVGGIG